MTSIEWSLSKEIRLICQRVQFLHHIPEVCKKMAERFRELKNKVQFNQKQCSYLCDSFSIVLDELDWSIGREIKDIQQKAIELKKKSIRQCADFDHCLLLCYDAFLELKHAIQDGESLVTACTQEDWCRSAIIMSGPGDTVHCKGKAGLKSPFFVCVLKFIWSLDVVENAFMVLTRNPHFRYRERLNLFLKDSSSNENGLTLQSLTELLVGNKATDLGEINNLVLDAVSFRELHDRHALSRKLKAVVDDYFRHDDDFLQRREIAQFLLNKLGGPPPRGECLPETFWINHEDLKREKFLGQGSFGTVFEKMWFGLHVAVKIKLRINRDLLAKEATILAGVQHPHVVQLIGCAYKEEDRTGMLVMELMCRNLFSLINERMDSSVNADNRSPFNLVVATDIMLQIAKAMEYLRHCGVLHRDLRSANVLLNSTNLSDGERFQIKVSDFGQSKYEMEMEEKSTLFSKKPREASRWRAPEVFEDRDVASDEYSWEADVYSFGMTCYEILSGRVPFDGARIECLLDKIKDGERPAIPDYCPKYLSDFIQQCWAADPKERPSFAEIHKKLAYYKKLILMRSSSKSWYPSDFIDLEKILILRAAQESSNLRNGSEKALSV